MKGREEGRKGWREGGRKEGKERRMKEKRNNLYFWLIKLHAFALRILAWTRSCKKMQSGRQEIYTSQ